MTTPTGLGGKQRAPPPQLLFDDGSRVMAEAAAAASTATSASTTSPSSTSPGVTSIRGDVPIEMYFEIDRITEELLTQYHNSRSSSIDHDDNNDEKDVIKDRLFRVALQFPDELLDDSPEVCWLMEEQLIERLPTDISPFVFCLGDTTMGPCCPDEVAALHLQADVLVHYGHACLNPTETLPVVYSFGRLEMDVSNAVDCIENHQSEEGSTVSQEEKILILYEVGYHHAMDDFESALRKNRGTKEVVVGKIPQLTQTTKRQRRQRQRGPASCQSSSPCCDEGQQNDSKESTSCCRINSDSDVIVTPMISQPSECEGPTVETDIQIHRPLVVGGLELPDVISSWDDLKDFTIMFVGESESTSKRQYVNIMLQFLSLPTPPQAYWTYSPKAKSMSTSVPISLQKTLNRRFFLTQKARDANVFGILVSNLSQQHLIDVVKTLKACIQDAGKSSYSFAVGKINPAKLANFAEIECFVLVACQEYSLLDEEREYPVPVITPLELEVALGTLEWGEQAYSLDCQDVLRKDDGRASKRNTGFDEDDDDDDAPYFSLVSGKYVQVTGLGEPQDLDLENLPGRGQVTEYKSEAANFLKQRQYQGLQTQAGETEVRAAIVGQKGIASDYGGV